MRIFTFVIALLFVLSMPLDGLARRGGGGGGGRGFSGSRPSTGYSRPPSAATRPSSGFNLNRDMGAMQRPSSGIGSPGGPTVGNQLPGGFQGAGGPGAGGPSVG